nr:DUF2268 domain-containing putative Zn-dependent protease [Vibrio sp. S9_S30]
MHTELEHYFHLASKPLCKYFDLDDVDVTLSPYEKGEAPNSGVGGWAINRYRIEIMLDTNRDDVKSIIAKEVGAVLAHEVNHIERMKLGLPRDTLAENLVYEGLACHFEQKFNGGVTPSLFPGMEDVCWRNLLEEMEPKLTSKDFNFAEYFFGTDNGRFPKYAGYWVGFNLIAQYIEEHGVTEEIALSLPADAFFLNDALVRSLQRRNKSFER